MPRTLLLSVRFLDGRYHGAGTWPPSPARLFQALVAGGAQGKTLAEADRQALHWLETLPPPLIRAPAVSEGQGFTNFVPNNDLDAVGGDLRRVSEVRAGKTTRPKLFDEKAPLLYAWAFDGSKEDEFHAETVRKISERLYQLGRGVDMAWAIAEVLEESECAMRLNHHGGALHRPTMGGAGGGLLCPVSGSLASLVERFRENRKRFTEIGKGKRAQQLFTQSSKPRFISVPYDSPPHRLLFDLRESTPAAGFVTSPLTRAVRLVEWLRDSSVLRLKSAMPDKEALIDRVLIGRNATESDKPQRVRIVPLPSIGHAHADRAIRRVLVEIPSNCPLRAEDVAWGFSGLDLGVDYETGEVIRQDRAVLTPAEDERMLARYGFGDGEEASYHLWRTVTPMALPEDASRRRIDPALLHERAEQKDGIERTREEGRAATAVLKALRHAGIATQAETIRVQREPFEAKGARAETFAPGTRFAKERLWHVEIGFAAPVEGPLVIGDGRYLGLGLMAPVGDARRDVLIFALPAVALIAKTDGPVLVHAVRRALMALSRDDDGHVPPLFSGHEADGGPARSGQHRHVFIAADDTDGDERIDRIIVAAPWACDRSVFRRREPMVLFDRVASSLNDLRAGRLGVISLGKAGVPMANDALVGPALQWESRTPYRPTRHSGRRKDPAKEVMHDLIIECIRRGLPRPEVELMEMTAGPKGGDIAVRARLRFAVAAVGPIMLGRDSHMGGGVFAAMD